MRRILGSICVLFLLGAGGEDAVKEDLKKMQGEWVMSALEVNGIDVEPEKLGGATLTVKDNIYHVKLKDQEHSCQLTLRPDNTPREVDMFFQDGPNRDRTGKAIYKFEDGKLKLSRGLDVGQERPTEFSTAGGGNYFIVTWKKKS